MNKQKTAKGRGIEWTDYTHNPVSGCLHGCRWTMPDGKIAVCYAETIAERVAQAAYKDGFASHYWKPQLLNQPLNVKTPSRIFVGSMADVFGHWTPDDQIEAILDVARKADWHTFQFLTKNPVRALKFDIPGNCWIGASTPPDFMWGKALTPQVKAKMFRRTLDSLEQLWNRGAITWISAEPLSWDIAPALSERKRMIDWIVVGAASDGRTYHPPNAAHFTGVLDVVNSWAVAVFYKGNLKSLPLAAEKWREEFPVRSVTA